MLYTVECSFSDPATEAEWNDFYSVEKLPALISVNGFITSQRFRALTAGCPLYLAVHSIGGLDVLQSDEYRQKGGGNFACWQRQITDWHRNLYHGLERAPAVAADQYLVMTAIGPEPVIRMGLTAYQLDAVALERSPERRWLGKWTFPEPPVIEHLPRDVQVYLPITAQLTRAASVASQL